MSSLLVHCILLLVASLIMLGGKGQQPLGMLRFEFNDFEELPPALLTDDPAATEEKNPERAVPTLLPDPEWFDVPEIPSPAAPTAGGEPSPAGEPVLPVPASDLLFASDLPTGGGLAGRSPELRARLVRERGGTAASEDAVARALAWLAAHQRRGGSWRFQHGEGACQGRCRDEGTNGSSTGATALALLPFLGAGHTHQEGPHREVVRDGLYYLTSRGLETPHGADFQEGTMYAQGLAAIALCEALAMTGDETLRKPAQRAIDYICYAQHPVGGWRYFPGQPGDTTVTGWQLMALKSGQMAGLEVPSPVFARAGAYLDSVQTGEGAYYGYLTASRLPSPTAIGLLCRMYLGWRRGDERLARGVTYLANEGPSRDDMYFNYYAAQVLYHYDDPEWERWNARLRDHLVETQSGNQHESGSWYFAHEHALPGGRLYNTAICAMILEVYYRHMPLYQRRAVETGF